MDKLTELKEKFKMVILQDVVIEEGERLGLMDNIYEVSEECSSSLSNQDTLEILSLDNTLGKLDSRFLDTQENFSDMFEVLRKNISNYLDEVFCYEVAKSEGFTII